MQTRVCLKKGLFDCRSFSQLKVIRRYKTVTSIVKSIRLTGQTAALLGAVLGHELDLWM
jgi:plasmid maintenance system antidote protein VapI